MLKVYLCRLGVIETEAIAFSSLAWSRVYAVSVGGLRLLRILSLSDPILVLWHTS